MKKYLILVPIVLVLLSCGTSKTLKQSKKVIKGSWILDKISYSEYGTFRMTFFDDSTKECFESSRWEFVPNNNTGTYNILGLNCNSGVRNFIFVIQEIDAETGLYDFLLKPTDEKGKSETNKGFRVKLTRLSDSEMEWQQIASIDDKSIKINMSFIKN